MKDHKIINDNGIGTTRIIKNTPMQDVIKGWEEDLKKILRMWHYDFVRENGIKQLEDFIQAKIQEARESEKSQLIKEIEELLVERIDLECEVVECDCGEKISEWNIANMEKEKLQEILKVMKHKML